MARKSYGYGIVHHYLNWWLWQLVRLVFIIKSYDITVYKSKMSPTPCRGYKTLVNGYLNNVEPVLADRRLPRHLPRWEEIVLCHLCIKTYLPYSLLPNDWWRCVACDCDLTVEHVLIEYGDFAEIRQRHWFQQRIYNNYSRKWMLCIRLTSCMR